MKSYMKISFFVWFHCLKHIYSTNGHYMLDILLYKKETEIKKMLFEHLEQKQKCSVFTCVQYSYYTNCCIRQGMAPKYFL